MVKRSAYILGAGMSGLVAAYEFTKRGWAVHVIEKLPVPGGLARTERFTDYYVDAGPHLFHTSREEISNYWKKTFPDEFLHPDLYGQNFIDGKFFDYPLTEEALEQFSPELLAQIRREMAAYDAQRLSTAVNYFEYMEALAGPTLQRIFYQEYPEKVWGMPVTALSPNWAPQRIQIRKERKPFHADQWSGVARNGCGRIMEILADRIREHGGTIHLEREVIGLTTANGRICRIETNSGAIDVRSGDAVLSTLPITVNAHYLQIPCKLQFRSVKLVALVLRGADPFPKEADWLYFKNRDVLFHRAGLQTRFSREGIPDGLHILCCEIAYSPSDEVARMSHEAIVSRTTEDLVRLDMLTSQLIEGAHVIDLGPVYPGYRVGYETELQGVRAGLERYSNFYFTGTLADFSYADFQILCAKSIDMVELISSTEFKYNSVQRPMARNVKFHKEITLGQHTIGPDHPPYIIGEIGLNHNGNVDLAKKLIDCCADAGCHAAKFQSFGRERTSRKVLDARYSEDILALEENLSELFDRLIFTRSELQDIFEHARRQRIDVFSTPFDIESVKLLQTLEVPAFKIASMDVVNLPLIRAAASTMKPIIMSTGMSTLGDIEEAVNAVKETGNSNLILLHCVSSYPASAEESNLRVIDQLSRTFGTLSGFSDHHPEIFLASAAIALGARVIEKHVTLDRSMKGPDHIFSLEPDELRRLVAQSRNVFDALGSGQKCVTPGEYRTLQRLRRSLFANRDIPEGTLIESDMLVVKSPGIGILPKYMDLIVGRVARAPIHADHPITWNSI